MPKVFATVPGAEIWIPPYGTATNDRGVIVPAAVGEELARAEGLRVEADEPPSAPKKKQSVPQEAAKKE